VTKIAHLSLSDRQKWERRHLKWNESCFKFGDFRYSFLYTI